MKTYLIAAFFYSCLLLSMEPKLPQLDLDGLGTLDSCLQQLSAERRREEELRRKRRIQQADKVREDRQALAQSVRKSLAPDDSRLDRLKKHLQD